MDPLEERDVSLGHGVDAVLGAARHGDLEVLLAVRPLRLHPRDVVVGLHLERVGSGVFALVTSDAPALVDEERDVEVGPRVFAEGDTGERVLEHAGLAEQNPAGVVHGPPALVLERVPRLVQELGHGCRVLLVAIRKHGDVRVARLHALPVAGLDLVEGCGVIHAEQGVQVVMDELIVRG